MTKKAPPIHEHMLAKTKNLTEAQALLEVAAREQRVRRAAHKLELRLVKTHNRYYKLEPHAYLYTLLEPDQTVVWFGDKLSEIEAYLADELAATETPEVAHG